MLSNISPFQDGQSKYLMFLDVRNNPIFTICLLILAYNVYIWLSWLRRNRQFKLYEADNKCSNAPVITSSLITGLRHKWSRLYQRGDIFNDYMHTVFLEHGPTHAIAKPLTGEVKAIYTIEPENVKTILSSNFADYHRPRTMPNALNPVMGQGVFTSNGEDWAHSRSLVKAQFSTRSIRKVQNLDVHVDNIFEAIGDPATVGDWTEETEILQVFNRFTLDAATEFMFGTSAESHAAAMREKAQRSNPSKSASGYTVMKRDFWARNGLTMEDFGASFDIALDYVALRLKLGRLWFLADSPRFRLACRSVNRFADRYIQAAADHAAQAGAFGARLKTTSKSDTIQNSLTDDGPDDQRFGLITDLVTSYPSQLALRNQVMQLLVAGRDTTAATLTWTFILLESHPDIFSRLRTAITAHFGTESKPLKDITFDSLRACTYLQWVIFEVLRLYPTGPLNARRASVDTILPVGSVGDGSSCRIAVKKGTTVAWNTYLMHRREDIWGPSARRFEPERWDGRKTGWEYVPFHGGPQTCLGQQHALTEMAYVLTRMLQRFDAISSSTRATNFENGIRTILVPKRKVLLKFRNSSD